MGETWDSFHKQLREMDMGNKTRQKLGETRGGPRANSGRKPDPNKKVPTGMRLSRDIKEYLSTLPDATDAVEAAIRGSRGYKEWKRK